MAAIFSAVASDSDPETLAADAQPLRGSVWHVRLLGGIEARSGDVLLRHFVSRPIAALLARLALQPQRAHPREELIELLWPGVDLAAGRNRLRNAISSLRRLLESPDAPAGSVLIADRQGVQLAPGTSRCDVIEFERCVRERRFDDARRWHTGELLPGLYEDWVQEERARVAVLLERVEQALAASASSEAAHAAEQVDPAAVLPRPIPLQLAPMPPARSTRMLPTYLTAYFGREQERLRLAEQVIGRRLVTLIGMGGAGKTRLAVEVAQGIGGFDVVAFAALAECTTAAQSAAQLRVALQLPPGPESLASVVSFLTGARALLVLDNYEQLVSGDGLDLIDGLLERLPQLHLLVTSRRALGLPGECEFGLAPLPQPDPAAGLRAIVGSPSVALFVDRARNVRPDFQVTERNRESIAALCCALEGMPLAIELAASRSRAFAPGDMHAALAERFTLLARRVTRPGKTALRHDSLRAAIDWSWQLLSARQQRFLIALSVFRGGWSARSAQAVCDESQAHELLEQLAADSLLRVDARDDGTLRFGMLEMIRDYVRERLPEDEASLLRHRHRAHYLAIASAPRGAGGQTIDAVDLPNFNEALRSADHDRRFDLVLALALALRDHWERRGIEPASLALIDRALGQVALHDRAWVEACTMAAGLSLSIGDVPGAQRLADAALAKAEPFSAARAFALCARVRIASETHRKAEGLADELDEAIAIARRIGAVDVQAQCLGLLCMLTLRMKRGPQQADAFACEARQLYQSIGFEREANALLYERTMCLFEAGSHAEALIQAQAFEQESIVLGDLHRQIRAINQQGVILAAMRRWADALDAYGRCVRLAWEMHNHYWLVFALWNHCRNLARLRQPERAALLMAFSERYWCTRFGELEADEHRFVRQVRALVAHQVGKARLASLWREGIGMTMAQAVRLALP